MCGVVNGGEVKRERENVNCKKTTEDSKEEG